MEHKGEALSRYEVECAPTTGKLVWVRNPTLFESSGQLHRLQLKLFELEDALGDGWLKLLQLDEYAPRKPKQPQVLQRALFAYPEAL